MLSSCKSSVSLVCCVHCAREIPQTAHPVPGHGARERAREALQHGQRVIVIAPLRCTKTPHQFVTYLQPSHKLLTSQRRRWAVFVGTPCEGVPALSLQGSVGQTQPPTCWGSSPGRSASSEAALRTDSSCTVPGCQRACRPLAWDAAAKTAPDPACAAMVLCEGFHVRNCGVSQQVTATTGAAARAVPNCQKPNLHWCVIY